MKEKMIRCIRKVTEKDEDDFATTKLQKREKISQKDGKDPTRITRIDLSNTKSIKHDHDLCFLFSKDLETFPSSYIFVPLQST
jgi:hypothetical protein